MRYPGVHPELAVLVVVLAVAPASADPDHRPSDRFAFAIAISEATSSGDVSGFRHPAETLPGIGWETSYWPNDYLGFSYDFELVRVPPSTEVMESTNTGLGVAAVVAVPLRYIQPYGGVWGGVRYNFVESDSRGANLTWAPRAGVNFYIDSNLRLFAQWEQLRLEDDARSRGTVVSIGARLSPDVFHRQRGFTKFNAVWGFASMSVVLWAATSILIGRE